ncbi:hypothetical protein BGW38_011001 [Lunasporangiospora selenospora]|uniref:MYND-type domain-containing protein n=1 Tax=Lunasporangiospora selenospora TaxID=979761 RepID=A0A9P6FW91_9FUNG|nr:hypothetical protein BGW38_011001 [Lunasporangiospora selenospora]
MPRTSNAMSSILFEQKHLLAFEDLPGENDIDDRYHRMQDGHLLVNRIHWCFMAEIVEVGTFIRVRLLVRDRKGQEIPIAFHLDNDTPINPMIFTKGSTIFILYADQHYFADGTVGIRVEYGQHVLVMQHSMSDILKAQSVTPGECQKCQKPAGSRCAKCHKATYCSRECQVSHWGAHKKNCAILRITNRIAATVEAPYVDFASLTEEGGDMMTPI